VAEARIKILPPLLCNKIAAGEVVQRPSSVVKELVENALDAGATAIDMALEDGGRRLIQVVDNGCGMTPEELSLAVQRHATSKIDTVEDLEHITTLGFRGEALPSIGSVSMLEIVSRPPEQDTAYMLQVKAGQILEPQPVSMAAGTRVTVRNLFFNVPARLKFLKGKRTELNHILGIFKPLALAYPQVSFKIRSDGKVIYDLRPGDLQHRIQELFGRDYSTKLVAVEFTAGGFKVEGFIGNLDLVRTARGEQFLLVNGRPVSDRLLSSAVYQGYRSLISRGEYPFYVLVLQIPPSEMDVNVHPTKLEVKFRDEWRVYYVVKEAVEQGLRQLGAMLPGLEKPQTFNPLRTPPASPSQPALHFNVPSTPQEERGEDLLAKARRFRQMLQTDSTEPAPERVEGFIWQVHNKYILSQITSGIAIIDQHVAHERILYEEALKNLEQQRGSAQQLLFPQAVQLSADDYELLLELLPMLQKLGFQLREFGPRTVLVEAVPVDMRSGSEGTVLKEILDNYRGAREFEYSPPKRLAASFACKAAIKAGDPLTEAEMRTLVDRLFATEHPFYCPHGRPIIINLTLEELDRRFERH